jgi:hypothetical protein
MCDLKKFLTLADARYERGKEGRRGEWRKERRGEGRGGEGTATSGIRNPANLTRGTSLIVSIKLRF